MDLADELLEDLAASAEAEAEPSTGELVGKNRDVEVGTEEPPLNSKFKNMPDAW